MAPARRVLGVLLLLAALGASGCSASDDTGSTARDPNLARAGWLVVCTTMPYEPFAFVRDGKPVGFHIDLATELAKSLGLKPVFRSEDFDDLASGELLNDGTCDVAVAGLTIAGDRARTLDFSSPYFDAAQTLVVSRGSGITSLEDLADRQVAVRGGSSGETYVADHAPSSTETVPFNDPSHMADAVDRDEVTAAVYDSAVVREILAEHEDLVVAAEFDTGEQYGMAVKKNGNVDLLRSINDLLATLKENGGYDRIYSTWFGTSPAS